MVSTHLLVRVVFALIIALLIPSVGFAQSYGDFYSDSYLQETARGYRNTSRLQLLISDTPEPIVDNQQLTYTITVKNNADYTERLVVQAFADPQTTVLSSSERGVERGNAVIWDNIIIGPESEKTLTVRVRTNTELQGNELVFRANAGGISGTETTRIDHRDTSVAPPAPPAFHGDATQNFQVLLSTSADGATVNYNITVANRTDRTARNVEVVQFIDALTRDIDILFAGGGVDRGDRITWSMGDLRPFEARSIKTTIAYRSGTPRVRIEATSESPVQKAMTTSAGNIRNTPPPQTTYQPIGAPNQYAYDDLNPARYIYNAPRDHRNVVYPQTGAVSDFFKKNEDMSGFMTAANSPHGSMNGAFTLAGVVTLAGLTVLKKIALF